MKRTLLTLLMVVAFGAMASAGDQSDSGYGPKGDNVLFRLHWAVAIAVRQLREDLAKLGEWDIDPTNEQMRQIHADEKALDKAVEKWRWINQ